MPDLAARFVAESRHRLIDVYRPRLRSAVERLDPAATWWRPTPGSLAFGTLLIHLDGNLRQWILDGIGGRSQERDRDAEFAAQDGPAAADLLPALEATLDRVAEVLGELDAERLAETVTIQDEPVGVLEALYHVVEHFGWHVGQAVWISKARPRAGSGDPPES